MIAPAPDGDPIEEDCVQPASLDLRLGRVAYRLRCSFVPGKNDRVMDSLKAFVVGPAIDLSAGAILERNRPYLVPLQEELRLPHTVRGRANPKSSTGRLDVFTRVITDRNARFDDIRGGHQGGMYLEVVPRSFAITVRTGLALNQLRLMTGSLKVPDSEIRALHRSAPLLYRNDVPLDRRDLRTVDGLFLSLDLARRGATPVGYRARHNSNLVDMSITDSYEPHDYWESVVPDPGNRVILEPEDFYLLLSAEAICIPPDLAAEMTAFDPSGGEVRTHYAGFFDPGFGHDFDGLLRGSRAALEIRAHDVPFAVENRQRVCRLRFERMAEQPALLYGTHMRSHYQGQQSTLSKHFKRALPSPQLSLRLDTTSRSRREAQAAAPDIVQLPEQGELDS